LSSNNLHKDIISKYTLGRKQILTFKFSELVESCKYGIMMAWAFAHASNPLFWAQKLSQVRKTYVCKSGCRL